MNNDNKFYACEQYTRNIYDPSGKAREGSGGIGRDREGSGGIGRDREGSGGQKNIKLLSTIQP